MIKKKMPAIQTQPQKNPPHPCAEILPRLSHPRPPLRRQHPHQLYYRARLRVRLRQDPSLSPDPPLLRRPLRCRLLIHPHRIPVPFRRLRQLSLSFPSPSGDPSDRIFIHAANSAEDLLALLDRSDELLTAPRQQPPIRFIVINSIAALFWLEFGNSPSDLKQRTLFFFKIAGKLKAQAARFGIAVVVTNQVVDSVDEEGPNGLRIGNYEALYSSGRRVCPTLGLAWANCMNSRVFSSRSEEVVNSEARTQRRMQLVFSPHSPESSRECAIVREGVFGVG